MFSVCFVLFYFFFFSSRRRHTRCSRDWSSDVCSSDLVLLEDIQPRISSLVADTTEMVHLARGQAQKVDRVFSEAADRLRLQVIRVDQILSGALEAIEQAGAQIRRTIWSPLNQASAFIKGVKTGLYVLRSQNRPRNRSVEHQDEELFI